MGKKLTLNRMTEVAHPLECHPRVMFNGDDTHDGTEMEYWEMAESTEVLQKGSHGGSKSSGSFQHEWHEAPGVVHVRAKKRSELVLLLPDVVFYGERLPGEAGECGILLLVGIILAAAALLMTRSPTSGGGIRLGVRGLI
jgi:hypothetical protein